MAIKAWTDIADSEIDRESPVTEGLLGKFHDNQESLITQQIDCKFDEASTSAATLTLIRTFEVFIPAAVATGLGDTPLVIRFEAKVASSTGEVDMRIAGGTGSTTGAVITNTSYGTTFELELDSDEVKAKAGQIAQIEVRAKNVGAVQIDVRNLFGSSRIERRI